MAITNADGSIILSTKIDTKGLQEAMAKMRQQAKGTGSAFESLSNAIKVQETRLASLRQQYASYVIRNEQGSAAAKKLSKDIKALSGSLEQNQQKLVSASASAVGFGAKAKAAFAGVGTSLKVLASYLIGIRTIFAAINFSKSGAEFATQTEASVQRLVDIYGSASDSVGDFVDANARALGMSKAAAASFSSVYGNLFSVWADQVTNAELTNRYLQMTAVVASKTGRTVEDVQERVRSGLLGNTEAIEDLGIFVNVKTIEMTDAFQRMANGKSWEQLDAYTQQQIRSIAILEQATAKYGDEVADTSATVRNQYKAAYEDFKNSWGNIVNTVLLPVLQVLAQIFDIATKGLNALSRRSGKTLENVELQEENTEKTAENIEEQTKNQKELNKELQKSLAGFDDIQILSSKSSENIESAETSGIDKDIIQTPEAEGEDLQNKVNEKLAAIIAGVGFALAALGIILICFGQIGWGIGLLIAGIAIFSVSEASLSDTISDDTKKTLNKIIAIVSAAILALGIILVVTGGSLPLGIGLIIAGAAGLATEAALNWDLVKEKIEKIFVDYGEVVSAAGAAMIIIGILLCCSGIGIGWGVALIIIGAASVTTEVVLNWDFVKEKAEYIFTEFGGIVSAAGAALVVLGIILCCTGVGIGLGIGLIVAGAAAITGAVAFNWDTILDWLDGLWKSIKAFWDKYIAKVFTAKFWLDLAKVCGNGLISGFESAVNGIIWLFEGMINFVVDGLNLFLRSVDAVISAVGNVFGQDWGVATIPRASLGRISIPRLAQGAVIPPNREFLAVLGDQKQGTNIEAPLQTIVDAFNIALAQNGNVGGGNTEVVLEIDGREFGRAVVEQGNRENRRIGTRLVIA